jgi:DNA-binding MarR family transcriptional regulator
MGHSTAAATGLVDRLEKLGYVERIHAADDRRKVMVQITDQGLELVQKIREGIVKSLADVMDSMDGDDKEKILAATERVPDGARSAG